ncbi:hypothetical protein KKD71_00300, partial [Patescibacteria group bacterium]|nr:hypothetical protein [Patescibacteria group bacterium]
MWLTKAEQPTTETRFLDDILADLEQDPALVLRANKTIEKMKKKYPVLADALAAPQSSNKHGEGPRVEDHVRHGLICLYALLDGKFRLLEIEEFRRLKGYEGEIEEIERTIKERAAFFEAFVFFHDIGKGSAIQFRAREGTKGAELGFGKDLKLGWEELGGEGVFVARMKYDELFENYIAEHSAADPREVQKDFFQEYGISISNRGHDKAIYVPRFQEVVREAAAEMRLPEHDVDLLIEVIASHMKPLHMFWTKADPKNYQLLVDHVVNLGHDPDDFLDVLLAGVALDVAFGNEQVSSTGYKHPFRVIENFLRAEHDFAPWKREEAEIEKNKKLKKL